MSAKAQTTTSSSGIIAALPESIERWTSGRKASVVLALLKNEVTEAEAHKRHDIPQSEMRSWVQKFLEGGENALRTKPREVNDNGEFMRMRQKIGELVIENDTLRALIPSRERNVS